MGLNKKALKLAGFKRCGLGAKHHGSMESSIITMSSHVSPVSVS